MPRRWHARPPPASWLYPTHRRAPCFFPPCTLQGAIQTSISIIRRTGTSRTIGIGAYGWLDTPAACAAPGVHFGHECNSRPVGAFLSSLRVSIRVDCRGRCICGRGVGMDARHGRDGAAVAELVLDCVGASAVPRRGPCPGIAVGSLFVMCRLRAARACGPCPEPAAWRTRSPTTSSPRRRPKLLGRASPALSRSLSRSLALSLSRSLALSPRPPRTRVLLARLMARIPDSQIPWVPTNTSRSSGSASSLM